MRTREPRRDVFFKARMRSDGSWSDVTIRNMSSRGMMLWSDQPPKPGAYVEICGPSTTMVVRTVWADGSYFGVRTQDKLDVECALRGGRWRPSDDAANDAAPKPQVHRDTNTSHAASRTRGAWLEYCVLFFGIVGAAILGATLLHRVLAHPFAEISTKLGG